MYKNIKVVECSDHRELYGILRIKDITIKEVQDKIYEIKKRFSNDEWYDWTIYDVFTNFPDEWEWKFTKYDDRYVVEI